VTIKNTLWRSLFPDLVSRMKWFFKPAPVVMETEITTPADLLNDALCALRLAEVEFTEAHLAVNNFLVQHPEHLPVKEVGDKTYLTFKPGDPEFQRLQSRENAAITARSNAMARWSALKEKVDSRESRHIAGVLMP
jgi:hypothetical protein